MTTLKVLLVVTAVSHLLCCWCDRLITFAPGGRFKIEDLEDNERMAKLFRGMPLWRCEVSMLLGVATMFCSCMGYLVLCQWMDGFSHVHASIMVVCVLAFFIFGVVHHVICGAIEWLYLRFGLTERARRTVIEFFKKTSLTMVVAYIGIVAFCITLFVAVVSGATPLPRLACLLNPLLFAIPLVLLRVVGSANIACACTLIGLFFLV